MRYRYPESWISFARNGFMRKPGGNVAEEIREWVSVTTGSFSVTACDNELGFVTVRDRAHGRNLLKRLKEKGLIEPVGSKHGWYRRSDDQYQLIDWRNAAVESLENHRPHYRRNSG